VTDSLAAVAQYVSRTLAPLTTSLGTDGLLLQYFRKLGFELPAIPPALSALRTSSDQMVGALTKLERALRQRDDGTGSDTESARAAVDFVTALVAFTAAIRSLPQELKSQLPQPFIDGSHIAEQFLDRLFNDTLSRKLESESRNLYLLGQVLGLLETIAHAADPARFQPAWEERTIRWDRVALLGSGPGALMRDVYGWGTHTLDGTKLFLALRDLSFGILSPAYFDYASDALLKATIPGLPDDAQPQPGLLLPLLLDTPLEVVLGCYTMPTLTPGEQQGVMFTLAGFGSIGQSFDITPSLKLEVDAQIDLASGIALAVWPDRDPQLIGTVLSGTPTPVTDAKATLRLRYAPADKNEKLSLLNIGGLLLDARGVVMEVGLSSAADQGTDLRAKLALPGLHLQLGGLGQDSFLSEILPDSASIEMDFGLGWSLAHGLTWEGGAGPNVSIPVSLTIGPLKIDAVQIEFGAPEDTLELAVRATVSARLGPVFAQVQGVGLAVRLDTRGGNFGLFDLSGALKPPQGVALSIDVQGVVSGGGVLMHLEAESMYAGAMQLSVVDELTVKAFGLIATRLPDGSKGYSLLIFITAEDFQPIQLGLGFTLLGIGGMVGVNRTFDEDVLRQGMKNDTLGQILFPRDPVGNAVTLIRTLASAFPARRGSYLLGLLAKLGWFTPTLVYLDLALIWEFGARDRLLALGRVSALLPSADNDLVRLNMEAMGVIDFNAGTAAIDAMLIDSRLAHKFPITGSAAMRAGGSGAGSNFVLAVGGVNPHYTPPAGFPKVDRLAIALCSGKNPRLVCDAYFAITANTVQFGSHAALFASAGDFSVAGDVGFDVLVSVFPLHFIADFHARLQLKCGSHNLFMVKLAGELEGPRPLRVSGKASFSILWCDFSVHFDKTLVQGDPPPLPPAIDVLGQLTQALLAPASWTVQRTSRLAHGVALRSLPPASTMLVLDPIGQLAITQQVVPLNTAREIDIFGGAPVAGARQFRLTADLGVGTPMELAPLEAPFAPAQYFDMSDDEKLAAPSFESMEAGCVLGSSATKIDEHEILAAPLEYVTITLDLEAPDGGPSPAEPTSPPGTSDYTLTAGQLQFFARSGAVARAPVRSVGRARFSNAAAPSAATLNTKRWTIQPLADGAPAVVDPTVRTWSEYQGVLKTLNRARANWQVLPTYELDN